MAMKLVAPALIGASATLLLQGCGGGGEDPAPEPTPAPAPPAGVPAPAGASIQYFRFDNHSNLPDECNKYELADLGQKVADSCCTERTTDGWSFTPADDRINPWGDDNTTTYTCYVRERAAPNAGTYIRNFFGCSDGKLTGAEGCTPTGLGMGNGYPMNEETAKKHATEGGTIDSCNCEADARYAGAGCYVALSSYMKGLGSSPEATFLKITGSCPTAGTEFV